MQSSANELCLSLIGRGHQVAILAALAPGGLLGWKSRIELQINKRLSGCEVSRDSVCGYPVWRTSSPWDVVGYVANQERAELIVVMVGQIVRMALAAKRTRIPVLTLLQNVEFRTHGGRFRDLGKVSFIANSQFTADTYRLAYGINPRVIYPFIAADRYRTKRTRENVTFVNPHPLKGRDIALAIARLCPEIPFAFVETWRLPPAQRKTLIKELRSIPNVKFLPPCNDMRTIYGKCSILLAPSMWQEAYGRVATEAQINGIPVVGSSRGGLREAVGPGGILLDPKQPIADWAAAVRKLWHDERQYDALSAAALAHAERREMSSAYLLDAWESAMVAACQVEASR
jgi:glycosyltransferase involved in cell wall biosynthesis